MILDKQKAMPLPDLHLHFRVEKNGIILHEHDEVGHSWTWNAWNAFAMFSMYSGGFGEGAHSAGNLAMRRYGSDSWDTSATEQIFCFYTGSLFTVAGNGYANNAANANFGILVGTEDSAFATTNFALHGLIAHGNGASQLFYQAMGASVRAWDDGTKKFSNTFTRIYNNNSGGSITVKEAGLCSRGYGSYYYLLARDILDTPVVVPDGAQLTVTYVITSQDFTNCIAGLPPLPALGTAGMGGYSGPVVSYSSVGGGAADVWMYVISPIGGEYTSQWHSISQTTGSEEDKNGLTATEANITASRSHTTGVTDYRTATSIPDWYVPAEREMALVFTSAMVAALPAGHEVSNESYWTATRTSRNAYYQNPVTGAAGDGDQTISYKIRLVRRILISDWVADE